MKHEVHGKRWQGESYEVFFFSLHHYEHPQLFGARGVDAGSVPHTKGTR